MFVYCDTGLFVTLFVFVNLDFHGIDTLRHGFLEGVGLFAVEERLTRKGKGYFGYLVVVTFGFVDFEKHLALGRIVDDTINL